MSEYKENEVLIYSYFPFYIESVKDDEKNRTIYTIIQDEEACVSSNDGGKMKKFWNNEINSEIESEFQVEIDEIDIIDEILKKMSDSHLDTVNFEKVEKDSIRKIVESTLKLKNLKHLKKY